MKTFKAKYVTIRKEHKCFGCCRKFPIGTKMFYTVSICDSAFGAAYWCDICKEEIEKWPEWRDEGINEGAVINAMPELFEV